MLRSIKVIALGALAGLALGAAMSGPTHRSDPAMIVGNLTSSHGSYTPDPGKVHHAKSSPTPAPGEHSSPGSPSSHPSESPTTEPGNAPSSSATSEPTTAPTTPPAPPGSTQGGDGSGWHFNPSVDSSWTDYYSVAVLPPNPGNVKIAFRYQDDGDLYVCGIGAHGEVALFKVLGGKMTILGTGQFTYDPGATYNLAVAGLGGSIFCRVGVQTDQPNEWHPSYVKAQDTSIASGRTAISGPFTSFKSSRASGTEPSPSPRPSPTPSSKPTPNSHPSPTGTSLGTDVTTWAFNPNTTPTSSDYSVTAILRPDASGNAKVAFRFQDDGDFYACAISNTGKLYFGKQVKGTWTVLGTKTFSYAPDTLYTVILGGKGSGISCGVHLADGTTVSLGVVDSDIPAGRAAVTGYVRSFYVN